MNPRHKRALLIGWLCLVPTQAVAFAANPSVSLCHGFGCRLESNVTFSRAEWETVALVLQADDAVEERRQLKFALGYLEYLSGRRSPIGGDLGGNAGSGARGQLDCIDESINATRFLGLLTQGGLLRFHRVVSRAYRRSLVTQHWAAQVEDVASGRRFVYDTWFDDNGRPPVMVSSERWHDLWPGSRPMNLQRADLSQDRGGHIASRK